jgi:undecaprenyl-diphosphatase
MTISAPPPDRIPLALDLRICQAASRWAASAGVDRSFGLISRLGDGWLWYGLMAALSTGGGVRGVAAALQMIGTGVIGWLLYRTLKRRTRRPRPFRVIPGVIARAPPLDEYSFPSGHTLHAISMGIVATHWFPVLALPLGLFALLVATSRVVLGLHYPSDVLAGAALGALLGLASLRVAAVLITVAPGVLALS